MALRSKIPSDFAIPQSDLHVHVHVHVHVQYFATYRENPCFHSTPPALPSPFFQRRISRSRFPKEDPAVVLGCLGKYLQRLPFFCWRLRRAILGVSRGLGRFEIILVPSARFEKKRWKGWGVGFVRGLGFWGSLRRVGV